MSGRSSGLLAQPRKKSIGAGTKHSSRNYGSTTLLCSRLAVIRPARWREPAGDRREGRESAERKNVRRRFLLVVDSRAWSRRCLLLSTWVASQCLGNGAKI